WLDSVFLYGHSDHRGLHLFPTRRSSDLSGFRSANAADPPHTQLHRAMHPSPPRAEATPGPPLLAPRIPPPAAGRNRSRRVRAPADRKSTRLNSSHVKISYAVFCLKKKTT